MDFPTLWPGIVACRNGQPLAVPVSGGSPDLWILKKRHWSSLQLEPPSSQRRIHNITAMADLDRARKLLMIALPLVCAVHAPQFCLAVASPSWLDCGAGRPGSFTVSSVALRPEAPRRGQGLQVDVEGSVSEVITDGVMRATVFYLGFQVNVLNHVTVLKKRGSK